jgi:hypothetical protein
MTDDVESSIQYRHSSIICVDITVDMQSSTLYRHSSTICVDTIAHIEFPLNIDILQQFVLI